LCENCPPGKLTPLFGDTTCHPYSGANCGAGRYASWNPSSTRDLKCATCPHGQYQSSGSHRSASCTAWQLCNAGQTWNGDEATSTTTYGCEACPSGRYQPNNGHTTACDAKRTCGAGQRLTSDGSTSEDRTCGPCPDGQFQPSRSHLDSCADHRASSPHVVQGSACCRAPPRRATWSAPTVLSGSTSHPRPTAPPAALLGTSAMRGSTWQSMQAALLRMCAPRAPPADTSLLLSTTWPAMQNAYAVLGSA